MGCAPRANPSDRAYLLQGHVATCPYGVLHFQSLRTFFDYRGEGLQGGFDFFQADAGGPVQIGLAAAAPEG